jgi:predicted TIM-barrel fold metal-dependent hydrolase
VSDPRGRVDVHQHIVPPLYAEWLRKADPETGMPRPYWSVEDALAFMDANGITTGIVSVSTPGVHVGDNAEARRLARAVNEFAAQVAHEHPGRFGFFATLTLPDVPGAVAEARHALDYLRADGAVLLANAHGEYLGAAEHEPLFAELNERGAVVFVHPATLPGPGVPELPAFAVDFLLDTTRAAANMIRAGLVQRHRNLKVILAHAGGFVPYSANRIATTLAFLCQRPLDDVMADLRSFYFDTALSTPSALPSLLAFTGADHVLFGSDWPYAPTQVASRFTADFDAFYVADSEGHLMNRGNAERILPRLTR